VALAIAQGKVEYPPQTRYGSACQLFVMFRVSERITSIVSACLTLDRTRRPNIEEV
jgi:hypothetical protein